ncbi:MAG: ABC transporter permease subunit [Ktedonobacterales bacterium]
MVVYAAQTVVFGVWNIKGYFDTLPIELEQAALVDDATPAQAFLRITLPLAAPSLAASALFMFIGGWNEFPLANILHTVGLLRRRIGDDFRAGDDPVHLAATVLPERLDCWERQGLVRHPARHAR